MAQDCDYVKSWVKMKLTCVTAAFNCIKAGNRERLVRCIETVAKLKTEHEHLIYDGASTDGTVGLLRELESKTPGLKVVSEPDAGIYNALNKGVRDAQGEWFYVLGADDYISHPEVMDEFLCDENGVYDVIVAPVEIDGKFPYPLYKKPSDLKWILWRNPHSHQGLIMKTGMVRRLNGFDESCRVCADWDLALRTRMIGARYCYQELPFALYSMGGFSGVVNNHSFADRQIVKRHFGLSDCQFMRFSKRGYFPLVKTIKMFFHKDDILRMSARILIWNYIKSVLRIVLWPLVVVTRPLRRKLSRG